MPNQSIRECDRCVAIAKSGNRCRLRTCKGRKCWIHTKKDEGLRIKPSQIPNAGEGLYATKRFAKGERIADYTGEKMTRVQVGNRYPGHVTGEYVMCRSDTECFDGRKTNSQHLRRRHLKTSRIFLDPPDLGFVGRNIAFVTLIHLKRI